MAIDTFIDIAKFIFDFTIFFVIGPGIIILLIYRLLLRGALRRFFLYEDNNSFFHRLDPRVKIFWTFTVTLLASILDDLLTLLALFIWVVIMWGTAKPNRDKLATVTVLLLPIPLNSIFYQGIRYGYDWWSQTFIYDVTPIYEMHPALDYILGGHILTIEGMYYGAFQSLRILVAAGSGLLLATSTAPNALLLGLTNFIKRRSFRIGVPYVISFAVVIGIRLIPTMFEDANIIINAAKVRGLSIKVPRSRNPSELLKALRNAIKVFRHMTVPLILSSLRRGSNISIAADLRAFRAKPNRTYLIESRLSVVDWIYLLITIAVFIFGWYLAYIGFAATPGIIL